MDDKIELKSSGVEYSDLVNSYIKKKKEERKVEQSAFHFIAVTSICLSGDKEKRQTKQKRGGEGRAKVRREDKR